MTSILIVKPSSLGDIIHTLPAIHFLKRTFPKADLHWIVSIESLPLLEGNPDLTTLIPFPRHRFRGWKGIIEFHRWCGTLVKQEPDLVLDFQGLLRSAWIARCARGAKVLGMSDSREGAQLLYHARAVVGRDQHAVDRNLALARLAGANVSGPVSFLLPDGKHVSLPVRDFILLHPYARGKGKSLTPREIFELTEALNPWQVVIVGRSREKPGLSKNSISLVNQTDLLELIWLFRKATFAISVDSGPAHIGAAVSRRLLAVHTWTDPLRHGPYNPEAWVWKSGQILRVQGLANLSVSREIRPKRDIRPKPLIIATFVKEQLCNKSTER
ncbi:MAG: glycosyltransferase family 9 protein [Verrucomicrobia bacterium]|nr:glycosyltransferase family 9 protein [Verrucomicrobiota bacterium]